MMPRIILDDGSDASKLLYENARLRETKSLGYLPIQTVVKHIGLDVEEYCLVAHKYGNHCKVIVPERCCIVSGAIYVFCKRRLSELLLDYRDLLEDINWPTTPRKFIVKLARQWYENSHPVMPVIRQAFDDKT